MEKITEAEIDRIIENEREWRKVMLSDIKALKEELDDVKSSVNNSKLEFTKFKLKVATVASMCGGVAGYAPDALKKLFT